MGKVSKSKSSSSNRNAGHSSDSLPPAHKQLSQRAQGQQRPLVPPPPIQGAPRRQVSSDGSCSEEPLITNKPTKIQRPPKGFQTKQCSSPTSTTSYSIIESDSGKSTKTQHLTKGFQTRQHVPLRSTNAPVVTQRPPEIFQGEYPSNSTESEWDGIRRATQGAHQHGSTVSQELARSRFSRQPFSEAAEWPSSSSSDENSIANLTSISRTNPRKHRSRRNDDEERTVNLPPTRSPPPDRYPPVAPPIFDAVPPGLSSQKRARKIDQRDNGCKSLLTKCLAVLEDVRTYKQQKGRLNADKAFVEARLKPWERYRKEQHERKEQSELDGTTDVGAADVMVEIGLALDQIQQGERTLVAIKESNETARRAIASKLLALRNVRNKTMSLTWELRMDVTDPEVNPFSPGLEAIVDWWVRQYCVPKKILGFVPNKTSASAMELLQKEKGREKKGKKSGKKREEGGSSKSAHLNRSIGHGGGLGHGDGPGKGKKREKGGGNNN